MYQINVKITPFTSYLSTLFITWNTRYLYKPFPPIKGDILSNKYRQIYSSLTLIMANFCKVSVIAFFVLASGVILSSPTQAFRSSELDFGLALEPSSGNGEDIIPIEVYHYLDECLWKIGNECGPMFFTRIFIGMKNEIPVSCCKKLVDMGEECHDIITQSFFSRPEFSANATLYETRAVQAWNMCAY